jgi:predicted TIM-barrel fold metal-dependent hydrolase
MADEVHRVAKKGCHAFSENPTKINYPSLHDAHWDPFWQACSEENMVVNLHIGSSSSVVITSIDTSVDTMITLQPMSILQSAADLTWSPMLRKFGDLKFALSEGGIGWVPYFLERVDRVYKMHRA